MYKTTDTKIKKTESRSYQMNIDNNLRQDKNGKERIGYRNTVFFKTSDFEYLCLTGIIITSIFCVFAVVGEKIRPALIAGGVLIVLQYLMRICISSYYRVYHPNYQTRGTVVFEGNLDEAIFLFHEAGLKLKKKIGEYYIFNTRYLMLSNSELMVREVEGCCYLQGDARLIQELNKYINLSSKLMKSGR